MKSSMYLDLIDSLSNIFSINSDVAQKRIHNIDLNQRTELRAIELCIDGQILYKTNDNNIFRINNIIDDNRISATKIGFLKNNNIYIKKIEL